MAGVVLSGSNGIPEARHEILNETNRAEVERDIIAWLTAKRG